MKHLAAAASLVFVLGPVLGGCDTPFWHFDPLNIDGRAGGVGRPADYEMAMRVGAAAHAAGDFGGAVGLYRRAAGLSGSAPAPFIAAGNTLLEMGEVNEAIVAYQGALTRSEHDPEALRGLARAYLMTGEPELAGEPLAIAYHDTPDDPKLMQLIGVANDFIGQHEEAQARYRNALDLRPNDPAVSLNLALSLALTENFAAAIGILQPIAAAANASPRERLTLALIYGLKGDRAAAEQIARRDLDHESLLRNLAYYEDLRRLPPDERGRAIQTMSTQQARAPS